MCTLNIYLHIIFSDGPTNEPPNLAAPIAGSVAALVVVVAGIFVLVLLLRRGYGRLGKYLK